MSNVGDRKSAEDQPCYDLSTDDAHFSSIDGEHEMNVVMNIETNIERSRLTIEVGICLYSCTLLAVYVHT